MKQKTKAAPGESRTWKEPENGHRNKYEVTVDRLMELGPTGLVKLALELRSRKAGGAYVAAILAEALSAPIERQTEVDDFIGGNE